MLTISYSGPLVAGATSSEPIKLAHSSCSATDKYFYRPSGFAHLRFSILPVLGHRISCQDTGSSVAPASLVANMTPKSFRAVVIK
jgi:hypothetical protein